MTPREHSIRIAQRAAEELGVPWLDIIGRSRFGHIAQARKAVIRKLAEEKPYLSPAVMGEIFQRDRTTILYALGRIEKAR